MYKLKDIYVAESNLEDFKGQLNDIVEKNAPIANEAIILVSGRTKIIIYILIYAKTIYQKDINIYYRLNHNSLRQHLKILRIGQSNLI